MPFGIEIYGPDDTTLVFGSGLRTSNIQVYASYSLSSSNTSTTFTCPDANDAAKITIVILPSNVAAIAPTLTTTSTNFTLTSSNTKTGVVLAIRRA